MASHTAQGKEICRRLNSKNECFIKKCKFEHVCGMPGCSAPTLSLVTQKANKLEAHDEAQIQSLGRRITK